MKKKRLCPKCGKKVYYGILCNSCNYNNNNLTDKRTRLAKKQARLVKAII